MKVLKPLIILMILFFSGSVKAQVSVNINVGSPPAWGPAGYTETKYYYIPDVESYYDVPSARFIYLENGSWVRRAYLPTRYRNYDLYDGYKVIITDYSGNDPYVHFKNHKVKYKKGYKGSAQKTIGQKPGNGNNKIKSSGNKKTQQKSESKNQNVNTSKGGGNKGNKSSGNKGNGGGNGKKK